MAPRVVEVDHPLVRCLVSEARDVGTATPRFRHVISTAGMLLAYEATRDLAVAVKTVATPLEETPGARLAKPTTIVPILRAGLALAESMFRVVPAARTGHIGMFRDESTLTPVSYYDKLPADVSAGPVLLVDPMLATGGSVVAALDLLQRHGCHDVRFICLIAAPEGIARLHEHHPAVPIFTAAIDRQLDDNGYIRPGLGDAGDRAFGTL